MFWGETKEKRSFEDRHESTHAYIEFMRPRCVELARVLKKTGSFYYHCDWHASHYVKVMLDQILGENNFVNEIIWKRQSSHNDAKQGSKHLGRVHDTILLYSGGDYYFKHLYRPYDPVYVENFYKHVESGTGRRYRLGDLTAPGGAAPSKGNPHYEFLGVTRYWRYSQENMQKLYEQGRIVQTKPGAVPAYKRYLDEGKGTPLGSVWDDIGPVQGGAEERLGYPTQKPLKLLERIVEISSQPNDIVLDAFCGCGTALVAAQNSGRQWIGIDISPTSCRVMAKRLRDPRVCGLPENEAVDLPWTERQLRGLRRSSRTGQSSRWVVFSAGLVIRSVVPVGTKDASWMSGSVQVKQMDKVGRPDIDKFEAAMIRANRKRGFFVGFDYSQDAIAEAGRFFAKSNDEIALLHGARHRDAQNKVITY